MHTVVIVEDEQLETESLRRIIADNLQSAEIYDAPTGRRAMQLIDELDPIDLMFVDLNIPRPDGREVIRYLRDRNSTTRVIVTSANDDFDMVRSMLHLQVEDYLLKPVKKATIVDKIQCASSAPTAQIAELRQQINAPIEACDYPRWHDFLLTYLARRSEERGHERTLLLLDLLQRQPALKPVTKDKIRTLATLLGRPDEGKALYWRTLLTLLRAGEEIFDAAIKQRPMEFIDRAKFHIERNITGNVTLDAIAGKAFVSACYLSRMFKKSTGSGFASYVTRRKIQFARALLEDSDLNINTLALELGWQDANYFCRLFKKETGLSPSEYRRLRTETADA